MTIEEYHSLKVGDYILFKEHNNEALFLIFKIKNGIPYYNSIYMNYKTYSIKPYCLQIGDSQFGLFNIATDKKIIDHYYKLQVFK